jgi:small subunit ribosomal protein S9
VENYFTVENQRTIAVKPLETVELNEKADVRVRVAGGGIAGQAGAVRLGIARALEKYDGELRQALKDAGHLSRDPRKKERKKPGQPGARKRFQYSKR